MYLTNSAIGCSSTTGDDRVCHYERNYRRKNGVPSITLKKTFTSSSASLQMKAKINKQVTHSKYKALIHTHTV